MDTDFRRTGRTTKQMQEAPKGAIYVWCNSMLHYPRDLAAMLGRTDLEIVPPYWLESERWRGRTLTGLVLDHEAAARLTADQWDFYHSAQTRIR